MDIEEVQSVSVRKLISAFENQTNSPEATYFRPRTRSLGNILAKNVTVRENQFATLDEISDALEVIQQQLQVYDIYNKERHVAFQEELFNILTSIINIDNDDPIRARNLISTTKHLVSVLNNKLPSNNSVEHRYTKYSEQVNGTHQSNILVKKKETSKTNNNIKRENSVDLNKDIVKSTKETKGIGLTRSVSVKKLKELFQSDIKLSELPTHQNKYESKSEQTVKVSNTLKKSSTTTTVVTVPEAVNRVIKDERVYPYQEYYPVETASKDTDYAISVANLRNVFEVKSKEASTGLPLILKEHKPPITRFNYRSSVSEEPELISYTPNKLASEESSRLLELLKRDAESSNQSFEYSLNVSEQDDAGEVTPVESPNRDENDIMSSLEYIEENDNEYDNDSISGDSLNSAESVKTVESLNSNNNSSLRLNSNYIIDDNEEDDNEDNDYNDHGVKIEEINFDDTEYLPESEA
ncbi:putative uncharacterized protein DDB_G0292292 [Diabrotica virgifera virgifera]|uniref:Uncharacterized protein n=1 Tax=Diabrotica virgifera virgifera TaxID=50390 RepID=A0A6P7F846_DIAVI|nr:putative uncharacterized protein DDB_G0292292 [Diabrotica virgifera virgifera]